MKNRLDTLDKNEDISFVDVFPPHLRQSSNILSKQPGMPEIDSVRTSGK